jgi:hypothetical protein
MTEDDLKTVRSMIDEAIDKHNKSAALISACLGTFLLGFYTHGVITVVKNISK